MLGSRVRAPEGVQSKRLIINDYRSFCFCVSTLSSGIFGRERGPFRGNVYPFVYPVSRRVNRNANLLHNMCNLMTINVNAIFRKDNIKSNNTVPIHIRFTLNRKIRYVSTGVTIHIIKWGFENQRIKDNSPEMQELQYSIDSKLNEYRRKIKRLEALRLCKALHNRKSVEWHGPKQLFAGMITNRRARIVSPLHLFHDIPHDTPDREFIFRGDLDGLIFRIGGDEHDLIRLDAHTFERELPVDTGNR